MKKLKLIHYLIPIILLVISIVLLFSSCNVIVGKTIQLKLPVIKDTVKLEGKHHKMVYGAGRGALKVGYFKNGDILNASSDYPACIITNATRLNRQIAPYKQGYLSKSNKLKRIWKRNTKILR